MHKNERIYYFLLLLLSFATVLIIMPIIATLLFPKTEGILLYLRMMAPYPIALLIIEIVMRKSSGKTLKELTGKIDKLLFLIILITIFAISIIGSVSDSEIIRNDAKVKNIIISLIISIIFIPMQCYSEELIFRILPQRIALSDYFDSPLRDKIAVSIVSSAVFASLHLSNSEAQLFNNLALSFSYYFISAAFLSLLSFIERGYTSPIAYHTANNLFIAAVINRKDKATIPSEPFFIFNGNFEAINSIISLVWAMIIITAVVIIYKMQLRRAEIGKAEQ